VRPEHQVDDSTMMGSRYVQCPRCGEYYWTVIENHKCKMQDLERDGRRRVRRRRGVYLDEQPE
jgi:hypothetical protein